MSVTLGDYLDPPLPAHLTRWADRYLDLWGTGWEARPPELALRELMDKLGKSEVDDGLQRVFGAQLRVCAEITGVALIYNTKSRRPEKSSFEPAAFHRALDAVRAGLVELRCEHRTRLSHLIGRVTGLSDEETDHGLALVFTAEVFDSPEGRDIVRQVETRLRLGEAVGVSVGPAGEADTVLRSDGFEHVLASSMREISLVDRPAMPHSRVTSVRWRGKPAVYEADGLWQQRRRMVAQSRKARGLYEHRDCETLRGVCDFDGKRSVATRSPSDKRREAEKARLRATYRVYSQLLKPERFEQFLDDEVAASGR